MKTRRISILLMLQVLSLTAICSSAQVELSELVDQNPDIRRKAVRHLSLERPARTDALPFMLRLLNDPDALVRAETLQALAQMGPPVENLGDYVALTMDSDSRVRGKAFFVLRKLGPAAAPAMTSIVQQYDQGMAKDPGSKESLDLALNVSETLLTIDTLQSREVAGRIQIEITRLRQEQQVRKDAHDSQANRDQWKTPYDIQPPSRTTIYVSGAVVLILVVALFWWLL